MSAPDRAIRPGRATRRDRTVDGLRAYAIGRVVPGHSPPWFLLPLTLLIALTPALSGALARYGPTRPAALAVLLVGVTDLLGRIPGNGTSGAGSRVPVALLAAWLVPYLLGMALAGGRWSGRYGRPAGLRLLLGGGAGMTGLVLVAGYPASAVGVPGDGFSNLDPPSSFTVCLAALVGRPAGDPDPGPPAAVGSAEPGAADRPASARNDG